MSKNLSDALVEIKGITDPILTNQFNNSTRFLY